MRYLPWLAGLAVVALLACVVYLAILRRRRVIEEVADRAGPPPSDPRPPRRPVPAAPAAPAVPEWADFFTAEQYGRFDSLVRRHFERAGLPFHIEDGVVHVAGEQGAEGADDDEEVEEEREDEGGAATLGPRRGAYEYGLTNLAQTCNQLEPGEWEQFIEHHFRQMGKADEEQREVEASIGEFWKVREMLAVRIGPRQSMPLDLLVWREDLPGTVTYLVLDLPTTIQTIRPDQAEEWGKAEDELFEVALDNVLNMEAPAASRFEIEAGVEAVGLTGDYYTASRALLLDKHPECLGRHGSLVAIPHRHALLALPVDSLEVVKAVHVMALTARGMENEGPGSISPRLYYRFPDGRFIDLPYQVEEGTKTFTFKPPAEFVDLLNKLADEKGGPGPSREE